MILLGLGSNLGDRRTNLAIALRELGKAVDILCVSSVYETAALLPEKAPAEWDVPYHNIVISIEYYLSSSDLLYKAKLIERGMGREDVGRWGPRIIDIDVLAFHDEVRNMPHLTLPHPGMAERNFVMVPLAEIAPDWVHPVSRRTAAQMAAGMSLTPVADMGKWHTRQ